LCVRGSMGSLPSLAGLSLCEHGRRGGSAVLPASSSGIATDAPMLVWSVHMNRILFRYFPAIEASEDGESVVHDDDDEYDVVDAASDEEEAAIARNGPVTKRQRKKALTPYQAYLQWLRLCRVPSVPMKFTGAVKSIVDSEQLDRHLLDSAIRKANNALYETFKMGGERIQPAKIKQRVNFVNKASGPTLASVHISTLNASGRRKREDLYMKWLTSTQSTDGYTANRLDSVDESIWVDHIVPKSWLRLTNNFEEFASCENDPSNVVLTRKTFNENKHDKAIYFGNTGFLEKNTSKEWSPQGFVNKPAIARAIAYMFLTYPCVTSHPDTIVGHASSSLIGSPLYLRQIDELVENLQYVPSEEELVRAYVNFGYYGCINPLVVSQAARSLLATKDGALFSLLVSRLDGTDVASRKALSVFNDSVEL